MYVFPCSFLSWNDRHAPPHLLVLPPATHSESSRDPAPPLLPAGKHVLGCSYYLHVYHRPLQFPFARNKNLKGTYTQSNVLRIAELHFRPSDSESSYSECAASPARPQCLQCRGSPQAAIRVAFLAPVRLMPVLLHHPPC